MLVSSSGHWFFVAYKMIFLFSQFDYIIKCALSASVSPNVSYQDGCDGSVCCESGVNCCPSHGGYQFAYSLPDGSLISSIGNPIVECSNSCRCDPEKCVNRQVERGSKLNLEIFRTNDNRGWGVRTRAPVCRGTFIEEYVGEVNK